MFLFLFFDFVSFSIRSESCDELVTLALLSRTFCGRGEDGEVGVGWGGMVLEPVALLPMFLGGEFRGDEDFTREFGTLSTWMIRGVPNGGISRV